MGIDTQGDVRFGVAEALADGHDVDAAIDQLAGTRVSQGEKGHVRLADAGSKFAPGLAAAWVRGMVKRQQTINSEKGGWCRGHTRKGDRA